jgi:Divergent InlB B-repeat domain
MKRRNGPKWVLPILALTIFLFYFGDRVSGQGTPRGTLDASSDLPAATDRSSGVPEQTLTILRAGNGQGKVKTIPAGSSFKKGTTVTLEALPDPHSAFEGWRGSCSGSSRTCKVLMSTDRTVTVSFALKTYTIIVRPPVNGVIHPYGTIKAAHGEKRRFQIIPLPGYRISEVLVDKVSQGAINAYTFEEVTADHQVEAIFVKK